MTKGVFVDSLHGIKAEAEQALAREVDCSVISVPDYLDDFTRDAITAAVVDVDFPALEPLQIMSASEAVRLAYDFGTCNGKHNPEGFSLPSSTMHVVTYFGRTTFSRSLFIPICTLQ